MSQENKLTYDQKLDIANKYLYDNYEVDWYSLPDINSLHNADTEEEVVTLCEERIEELFY